MKYWSSSSGIDLWISSSLFSFLSLLAGKCGACWAFSTCASIEGAFAKAKDQLISLSEQELVDCDKTAKGCTGGNFDQV